MIFCPQCGTILRPREKGGKKTLWCSCGFATELKKAKEEPSLPSNETPENPKTETRRLDIVEEIETHPKIKITCAECGHKEAYYWTQQTRGADEPETRFFKCTKCKYTWREYS